MNMVYLEAQLPCTQIAAWNCGNWCWVCGLYWAVDMIFNQMGLQLPARIAMHYRAVSHGCCRGHFIHHADRFYMSHCSARTTAAGSLFHTRIKRTLSSLPKPPPNTPTTSTAASDAYVLCTIQNEAADLWWLLRSRPLPLDDTHQTHPPLLFLKILLKVTPISFYCVLVFLLTFRICPVKHLRTSRKALCKYIINITVLDWHSPCIVNDTAASCSFCVLIVNIPTHTL